MNIQVLSGYITNENTGATEGEGKEVDVHNAFNSTAGPKWGESCFLMFSTPSQGK